MKVASLDLGSNTFLLLVAEYLGTEVRVHQEELRVTRLAQSVAATGAFHPDALKRAEACLNEYSEIISQHKPDRVIATATSAARDAKNADELFALGKKFNIPIHIISGQEEAKVSFIGSTFDREEKTNLVVIDVGGGSTEVVGEGFKGHSLDVGSVRLTEMYGDDVSAVEKHVDDVLNEFSAYLPVQRPGLSLVAVAGTPTTMAAVIQGVPYTSEAVHGYVIKVCDLVLWRDKMAKMSLEDRKELVGMDPRRADVIVTGTSILLKVAKYYGLEEISVSDRGVRYGVGILAARGEL